MMGNFIQELCDQSRGGGGVTKKIILDHKGGGVQGGSKTDHEIFEQPLTLINSHKIALAMSLSFIMKTLSS